MTPYRRQGPDRRPGLFVFVAILAGATLWAFVATGFGFADAVFFGDIEDLPVMPGLVEDRDAGVSFDRPDGRIVEAVAVGPGTEAAVHAFYRQSLPPLGWRRENAGSPTFRRGDEILDIAAESAAGGMVVLRVSLKPAGNP